MDNEEVVQPLTEESILNSVKKLLGIMPESTEFDVDIMMHINGAISALRQIGVGPEYGFTVTSAEDTYDDYLGEGSAETSQVKLYLLYKTRLGFDPPQSSIVAEAIKTNVAEIEWRLNVQVDPTDTFE